MEKSVTGADRNQCNEKKKFQPVRLTGSWPPRQMPMQNLWSIAESMGQS